MLINKDLLTLLTRLMIGGQLCYQPYRSQVWRFVLIKMDFKFLGLQFSIVPSYLHLTFKEASRPWCCISVMFIHVYSGCSGLLYAHKNTWLWNLSRGKCTYICVMIMSIYPRLCPVALTYPVECGMKLLIHSQTSTMQSLKFGNG